MNIMFHALNRKFGVGVVLRNHLGIIVIASSKQILQPENVLEAQILVVLHGISLCIQLQVGPIKRSTLIQYLLLKLWLTRGETTMPLMMSIERFLPLPILF